MPATEFDDSQHYGIFATGSTLTSQTGKMVRQSELVLAALRAQGVFDNMEDGTVAPATNKLWLDKNSDPAVLKEYDSIGSAWVPMTFDRLFGRAVITQFTNVGGTGNAITVDEPDTFIAERLYSITPIANSTGATTLQVTGVGTFDVKYHDGSNLDSGEMVTGENKVLLFTSGRFEVLFATAQLSNAAQSAIAAQASAEAAASMSAQRFVRVTVVDTAEGDPASDYEAGDSVDGVSLTAGDIVLRATSGGDPSDGVYICQGAAAATRSSQFDAYDDHPGSYFAVMEGSTYADTLWLCSSNTGGTLDTTDIVITPYVGGPNPAFTTIELGHASDTTLARSAAGVMTIEGVVVLTVAGGTMTGALNFADQLLHRPLLKDYAETVVALGALGGGTIDLDLEDGNYFTGTVDTSTTTFTFSNPPATGRAGTFTLKLTNGGSQTVNWPASVRWAGGTEPTLTSSGVDTLVFETLDAGTTWDGYAAGLDQQVPA